jgi:hypothetical protein
MGAYATAMGIGLALAAISGWCVMLGMASTNQPSTVEQVLYAQGSVFHVPGSAIKEFTVPQPGGFFMGSINWDHSSVSAMVAPLGSHLVCPEAPTGYGGLPWLQWVNTTLAPGTYEFGALCGGFGNGTVTQAIELVYP